MCKTIYFIEVCLKYVNPPLPMVYYCFEGHKTFNYRDFFVMCELINLQVRKLDLYLLHYYFIGARLRGECGEHCGSRFL